MNKYHLSEKVTFVLCSVFFLQLNVGCNKSGFDAAEELKAKLPIGPSLETPSAEKSVITVSSPLVADGVTPAEITIEIKNWYGTVLPGITVNLTVTGSANTVVPCTPSNSSGISRCKIYTTKSETKLVSIWGPMTLSKSLFFDVHQIQQNVFDVVSSSGDETHMTGYRVVSNAGITETAAVVRDSSGARRVHSSIQGLVFNP